MEVISDLCCQTWAYELDERSASRSVDEVVTHRGGPTADSGWPPGPGRSSVHQARVSAGSWRKGCPPERIALLAPVRQRAPTRCESGSRRALERGYERLFVLTPSAWPRLILGDGRRRRARPRCSARAIAWRCCSSGSTSCRFNTTISAATPARCWGASYAGSTASRPRWSAPSTTPGGRRRQLGDPSRATPEREFAAVFRTHERMLAETGARDAGDLVLRRDADGPRAAGLGATIRASVARTTPRSSTLAQPCWPGPPESGD